MIRRAEVRHLALVDNRDLVKQLIQVLARLVQRDDTRAAERVSTDSHSTPKLERGARVETVGCVVPRRDAGAAEQGLRDANALLLATRDAADAGIANFGVASMPQAEDGHGDIG